MFFRDYFAKCTFIIGLDLFHTPVNLYFSSLRRVLNLLDWSQGPAGRKANKRAKEACGFTGKLI